MKKPRLLDLFCGAGGAAVGYARAGFDVVGVDHVRQPRYPFAFVKADALQYVAEHGRDFDVIHASPPCQRYSRMRRLPWLREKEYWDSIPPTREALKATGRAFVIENVEGAPLNTPVMLCGVSFGLHVYRHRFFESPLFLMAPPHEAHPEIVSPPGRRINDRIEASPGGFVNSATKSSVAIFGRAMEIDWMTRDELSQAIPPAYTGFLGRQIREAL